MLNQQLKPHILRADFQTFVLIFPDDGGIMIEQAGREFLASASQQLLGLLRGIFVGAVVIARAFALAIIPMGDGVNRFVVRRPRGEAGRNLRRNLIEGDESFVAVLTDEAGLADIAGEQRQARCAAAGGFAVSSGSGGEALVPDLALVADLRAESVRADERMRKPPGFAFQLTEGLREPAREGVIVKILKGTPVAFPKQIQRCVGVECHHAQHGGQVRLCRGDFNSAAGD